MPFWLHSPSSYTSNNAMFDFVSHDSSGSLWLDLGAGAGESESEAGAGRVSSEVIASQESTGHRTASGGSQPPARTAGRHIDQDLELNTSLKLLNLLAMLLWVRMRRLHRWFYDANLWWLKIDISIQPIGQWVLNINDLCRLLPMSMMYESLEKVTARMKKYVHAVFCKNKIQQSLFESGAIALVRSKLICIF